MKRCLPIHSVGSLRPWLVLLVYLSLGGSLAAGPVDSGRGAERSNQLYREGEELTVKGDYAGALAKYEASRKIAEERGDRKTVAEDWVGIGYVKMVRGEYAPAMELFQTAKKIAEEIGEKRVLISALTRIGNIYDRQGHYRESIASYEDALRIGEQGPYKQEIGITLNSLGSAYYRQGNYAPAVECFQKALKVVEEAGDQRGLAQALNNLAGMYRAQGFYGKAAEYYRRSLQIKEALQDKWGIKNALTAEIKQLEAEHDQLKEEIRQQDPTYANLVYPQPYTLEQIRAHLLDGDTVLLEYLLDEEQSLVYLVGRKELVIRRLPGRPRIEERITAFLDAVQAPAREAAAAWQTASRNLYQDLVAPIADRLARYRRVIIAADGGLYYLPFEALGAPSKSGLRYLTEDHEISYMPSATALGELLRRPRNRTEPAALLALGNPDLGQKEEMADAAAAETVVRDFYDAGFRLNALPFTGEEVQQIARYFRRSQVRVRGEASEDFIKHTALESYRVIHFATHGWLDEQNPKASSIVLSLAGQGSEDGFLQVREIYDLKLNADLVVLSACNTGRGRLINGEGIMGLTRAFFYAGTRSVLSSLWNVKDRSTADFMNQFYYHLQKGYGKAEALRAAKRAFLRSPNYQHPYYWAAFVLQGEPQETLAGNARGLNELLAGVAVLLVIGLYSRRFLRRHAAGRAPRPV